MEYAIGKIFLLGPYIGFVHYIDPDIENRIGIILFAKKRLFINCRAELDPVLLQ